MPTITEIYDRYHIPAGLRLHQLRVAAVAEQLAAALDRPLDRDEIVRTCLIHDTGNLLKFDLSLPELLEPEGSEYWERVKSEMQRKYGPDEKAATQAIAHELGATEEMAGRIAKIGFTQLEATLASADWSLKVCVYGDLRVGPHGVLTVAQRLDEGRKRYAGRSDRLVRPDMYEALVRAAQGLEQQLFEHARIKPADISDDSVRNRVESLKEFAFS
jgi:hypothetical protein